MCRYGYSDYGEHEVQFEGDKVHVEHWGEHGVQVEEGEGKVPPGQSYTQLFVVVSKCLWVDTCSFW